MSSSEISVISQGLAKSLSLANWPTSVRNNGFFLFWLCLITFFNIAGEAVKLESLTKIVNVLFPSVKFSKIAVSHPRRQFVVTLHALTQGLVTEFLITHNDCIRMRTMLY